MSRLRRTVIPFRWNAVSIAFTQGTAGTANLAAFLQNPQGLTITYSVIGTLPTGVTLSGSTVSYNGSAAASASSVQFRAVSGNFTADSSASTVTVNAAPVGNTAPVWRDTAPTSLGTYTTAGGTFDLAPHAFDAEADPIRYYRTGGAGDTAPGTVTVNETTGLVTIPAGLSAGNYSLVVQVSPSNTAESDWIARSTGPGVVWAHDFRHDAELTQFLWTDNGPLVNAVAPRLVSDSPNPAGRCLENVVIGAKLTAGFGTGDTTAYFDDLTDWPTGDFYFAIGGDPNAGRSYQSGIQYNLFYCPANNGSTAGRFGNELRGLVFQTSVGRWVTCTTTRRAWIAGDLAGNHVDRSWVRPFAALSSGNGLPSPDINNAGVTARAWQPITQNSAYATWGFGYYGHTDYHNLTWTSVQATASGSVPHGDCWDGDEFYLQMRVKVDPRFWNNHVPNPQTATTWLHKFFMIQTQQSSGQQLAIYLSSKNQYYVPGNANPPFAWHTHFLNDNPLTINNIFQPGGAWGATASFLNTPRAATGQATPDGSSAFAYDNDWVTLLFRIRPGHHLVTDTLLEVKAARRNGAYETVWSGNASIGFTQESNVAPYGRNDLPGWCALWLTSYLNLDINVSSNPLPVKSYVNRWTQVIFSKQPIPAPAVGA